MGRQWHNAQKAINGNPVDFTDVLSESASSLSGVATVTRLGTIQAHQAPRDGQIDFVLADITPAITSGTLNLAVYNNGTVVASGSVTSGRRFDRMYHYQSSNAGEPKAISSGSLTHIEYSMPTALDETGQVGRALNVRIGLRYRD